MSQGQQALGLLGVALLVLFHGLGFRLPWFARWRTLGGGVGLLCWAVAEATSSGARPPTWYAVGVGAGLALAGLLLLLGTFSDVGGDLDRALRAASAGQALLRAYRGDDDPATLERAVAALRLAEAGTRGRPGHLARATALVRALRVRYERLGRLADLDEAVALGARAAAGRGGGPGGRARRGRLQAQLATALRLRYDHVGALADLTEAARLGAAAVAAVPARDAEHPTACLEFAAVRYSRHLRDGDPAELDGAVDLVRRALEVTRRRGYVRPADLTSLCYLLVRRARVTGRSAVADLAVRHGEEALAATGPADPLLETCLGNLALALRTRFELAADGLADPDDLARAVALGERALRTTDADAPEYAVLQLNQALALYARHRARRPSGGRERRGGRPGGRPGGRRDEPPGGGQREWLARALARAEGAATHRRADPATRVRAGLAWSEMAAATGRFRLAATALESVLDLLPVLAARELTRADQEERLGRWTGVARTAAACALSAGQRERAVALLERGRGVLLSRALDGRADLAALRARHPELAEEFAALRAELERPLPSAAGVAGLARARRRQTGERWEALLARVRARPGFADFAGAPGVDRLLAEARHGPIVCLNVSERRSDALVLLPGGVRAVRLRLTVEDAERRGGALHAALADDRLDLARQRSVRDVLAWLWDTVAEPVLAELPPHGRGPRRLWWVPTGPLAALPVHAAHHPGDPARSLPDLAISSYAPTVRALVTARAGSRPAGRSPRPLVVAMTTTPGAGPLPHAAEEAELVAGHFPGTVRLADAEATGERVLAELPHHDWAHFACHGVADPHLPSRGRLLLHDHRERPLTVADVSGLALERGDLAYLSACGTAGVGARHADEQIHLASAFQLAGFRHVLATLWRLPDRAAARLAGLVYAELAADPTDPAAATHRAVAAAREVYPRLPGVWASLVHMGS